MTETSLPPVLERSVEIRVEDDRTSMHPVALERAVWDHLYYSCNKDEHTATPLDIFQAVSFAARDRLVARWRRTKRAYYDQDAKRAYYLSAEFLLGRQLAKNLEYLGLFDTSRRLLEGYGLSMDEILECEVDPGLGNGGLGRLAACFMDSMATLGLPGSGYGIRYEFGIFDQGIRDGRQVERADAWLRYGCPWELVRHEYTVPVRFGGREEALEDNDGYWPRWVGGQTVMGVPYDVPIPGLGTDHVNTLRLWSARASREFDLKVFNDGDYRRAVEEKALSESISKVLYPKDDSLQGRELRLKQQYFFVACSIADIIRRYRKTHDDFGAFADKVAIQLNDTHPSIAVAELMRVLVDEHRLQWERAWDITTRTVAFTNHTLLSEALETWPVDMFGRLLPRHLSIIYEINRRYLREVHVRAPGDYQLQRRVSLIDEGPPKRVRMAHLAVVGSHSVNGVAALHTELLRSRVLTDFANLEPLKFNNKTNGVTHRRWLVLCNPGLAKAITDRIGDHWVGDFEGIRELEEYADEPDLQAELQQVKLANKMTLARIIRDRHGLVVDPSSIFDVQVKRLHEYKRQLLNCMHVISKYCAIKTNPDGDFVPRTVIFGGKAAPGYAMAKLHIKLIHDIADIVNNDPVVADRLKVVFLANYQVSLAERIIPATDLSEQISMAGKEASGTGNMKFAMNGALTIGTLDGANIEIREQVGADNFFLFGNTAEQVRELKASGYRPQEWIASDPKLARVVEMIGEGFFSPDQRDRFLSIGEHLLTHDEYLHCADFGGYLEQQEAVEALWRDRSAWTRSVIHNIAGTGMFSSDRTIRQYAEEIWNIQRVELDG